MRKLTKKMYTLAPHRYELRSGKACDATLCPYGNQYEWIGYDLNDKEYVRFTKSVFKALINLTNPN